MEFALLLLQVLGVLAQAFVEGVDVADHLGEDGSVTRVLHAITQLGGELLGVQRFLDLGIGSLPGAAALFQARASLVQRQQQGLVDAADLAPLRHHVGPFCSLGTLQQVNAVLVESRLQHVKAVGRTDHQPVGRLQRQTHVVGKLHVAVKGCAVTVHRPSHFVQGLAAGSPHLAFQGVVALQQRLGSLAQGLNVLGVTAQGVVLLHQAHALHLAAQDVHALQQRRPGRHVAQRQVAGGRHHCRERQHHAETERQLGRRAQTGHTPLDHRCHADSLHAGNRVDALAIPNNSANLGARPCWRQAMTAPIPR